MLEKSENNPHKTIEKAQSRGRTPLTEKPISFKSIDDVVLSDSEYLGGGAVLFDDQFEARGTGDAADLYIQKIERLGGEIDVIEALKAVESGTVYNIGQVGIKTRK